jgi:hypothetical protein
MAFDSVGIAGRRDNALYCIYLAGGFEGLAGPSSDTIGAPASGCVCSGLHTNCFRLTALPVGLGSVPVKRERGARVEPVLSCSQ